MGPIDTSILIPIRMWSLPKIATRVSRTRSTSSRQHRHTSWLTFNPEERAFEVRPELTFNLEFGKSLRGSSRTYIQPRRRESRALPRVHIRLGGEDVRPLFTPRHPQLPDLFPPLLDTAQQQDFSDRGGIMMPRCPRVLNTLRFQRGRFEY